jgi:hypothetical protein
MFTLSNRMAGVDMVHVAYKGVNQEFVHALNAPEVRKQLQDRNFDVVASSPEAFAQTIAEDRATFQRRC